MKEEWEVNHDLRDGFSYGLDEDEGGEDSSSSQGNSGNASNSGDDHSSTEQPASNGSHSS